MSHFKKLILTALVLAVLLFLSPGLGSAFTTILKELTMVTFWINLEMVLTVRLSVT